MKLQLVARHLRDDQDSIVWEHHDINTLLQRMKVEIEEDRSEGSNWRYHIRPTEEVYQ